MDSEKAYQICREPDFDKQRALLGTVASQTRDEVRRRVKGNDNAVETKVSAARFAMPGPMTVGVQGKGLTLALAIDVISETLRILKKGLAQGLDISTQQRVMKDSVRSANKGGH